MLAAFAAGTAAGVATLVGAHAAWRRWLGPPPAGLPAVLAYHKIGTPELGGTWCTRAQFAAHLDALQRAGYRGITTARFRQRLGALAAAPLQSSSHREVMLTFDDAYDSFAVHAWPELQRRGFPVLLFVITAFVGRRSQWDLPLPGRRATHLDWAALRALAAHGVEIGSHASTHRDLRRLPDTTLRRELEGSRQTLEDRLGAPVRAVSYPFGRCDARVVGAAAAAGYDLGFAMAAPAPNARVHRHALRRFGVYCIDTPRSVLDKVDAARHGFWLQDVLTRGIGAVAGVGAAASVGGTQRDGAGAARNDG